MKYLLIFWNYSQGLEEKGKREGEPCLATHLKEKGRKAVLRT